MMVGDRKGNIPWAAPITKEVSEKSKMWPKILQHLSAKQSKLLSSQDIISFCLSVRMTYFFVCHFRSTSSTNNHLSFHWLEILLTNMQKKPNTYNRPRDFVLSWLNWAHLNCSSIVRMSERSESPGSKSKLDWFIAATVWFNGTALELLLRSKLNSTFHQANHKEVQANPIKTIELWKNWQTKSREVSSDERL